MEGFSAEDEFLQKLSEISAEQRDEEISHEVDEWSSVLEKAETPEKRKTIIRSIMMLMRMESNAEENELHLRKSIDARVEDVREKAEARLKNYHKMINETRTSFGLPPKYTESE